MAAFPALSKFHMVSPGIRIGPLLFLLYTTPLSHLVQASVMHHHLFADDIQLYISFKPKDFNEAMSALSSAFQSISNWISANQLVLNPTETEFILIGRPLCQKSRYHSRL